MKKIKKFEKSMMADFRTDITNALSQVEKKYGIKFNQGTISYTDKTMNMKLNASLEIEEEVFKNVETSSLINKRFRIDGRSSTYTVIEVYHYDKSKMVVETNRGKRYVMEINDVAKYVTLYN